MADSTTVESKSSPTGALDAPTDMDQLVTVDTDRYHEDNENHVPNPLYSTGTLDTSDTAGSADSSIAEVSPVFEIARAQNLVTAAKALDPEDPTPSELVVLPQGSVTVTGSVRTADEAREEVASKLRNLADSPIELGGTTPAQRDAAEEDDDADNRHAQDSNRSTDDTTSGGAPATTQPNVSRSSGRTTRKN